MIYKLLVKVCRSLYFRLVIFFSGIITFIKLKGNKVSFKNNFKAYGIPIVNVDSTGKFTIGSNLIFNSGKYFNMIGRQQNCYFIVGPNAALHIGNNVSLSSTAIVCHKKITIEDNVKCGGNVIIYDTDFHSLNYFERNNIPEIYNTNSKEVIIKQGAFIGAHSTILKGVTIGENAIVAACSTITKNVPDNEIWGGNPAQLIRKVMHNG